MPFLQVNHAGFQRARELAGSDKALAELVGVTPTALSRVLSGIHEPTGRLVAGVLAGLGQGWFEVLFDVVDEGLKCTQILAPAAPGFTKPKSGRRRGSAKPASGSTPGRTSNRSA